MNPHRKKRVLLVEDEAFIVMLLEDILAEIGFEVMGPAASCAQAFALLEKHGAPDGAILDVNLGGERVFPLAAALAERHVPFVFSTGYGDGAIDDRFAGIERLRKPFDPNRLQATLAKHFAP
jgi:two-component SAPR family response regulator